MLSLIDRVTFYSFVVLAMVLMLPVISHRLRRYPRLLRWLNDGLLAVYLLANLYLTLLSRSMGPYHRMELTPLWSYTAAYYGDMELKEEVILNILLYIPLGYLLHYAFPRLKWWMIVVTGFLLSGLTESIQLFFKLGLCEVDDLISNTMGTVIGVGAYRAYKRLPRRKA
ncbi:MAG: VanZ family protein [Aristaeellaceae bacterium]